MKISLPEQRKQKSKTWDSKAISHPTQAHSCLTLKTDNLVIYDVPVGTGIGNHRYNLPMPNFSSVAQIVLERLMTAWAFENINICIPFFKLRHLKPVAPRHQLQRSIVCSERSHTIARSHLNCTENLIMNSGHLYNPVPSKR